MVCMPQGTSYKLFVPEGYKSKLNILETEKAIKSIKDYFETALAKKLCLTRVSAPLFVIPDTGLNDNLSGVERAVTFDIKYQGGVVAEIIHSLAKWKRYALKRYGIPCDEGLYTDMNAIRRDEVTDNLHSIYVDQWDWEKVISKEERTVDYLKAIVSDIYAVLKETESYIKGLYPVLNCYLPEKITFLTSQELEDMYPGVPSSERESLAAKKYGAIFIIGIGGKLKSGEKHDGRAPDYDDWNLNGDILLYNEVLGRAFEISSMGIRVDKESLEKQLKEAGCEDRKTFMFHKALLNDELPLTVGGGIGQSRLCMFLLDKAHVGEVQASVWPDEMIKECEEKGITLL
ncbi:MAG: aspartate--ammonia ligase [Clostridia bacterium]|nr:aspartate--ammonia ligase [Clostridia bacterium]